MRKRDYIIAQEDSEELDRQMRGFLAPFDIVKIKIFNRDARIIYSTDSMIIGESDKSNTNLAKALD